MVILLNQYLVYDATSYVIFRVINNDMLENLEDFELEAILYILLKANVSEVLVEYVAKYLSDNSQYKSEQYRAQQRTSRNIMFEYVSLFEEDV